MARLGFPADAASSFAAYRCGSRQGWSDIYGFRALRNGSDWSPRFVLYGDMGLVNPQSLPRLTQDTAKGMYDVLLHVGMWGARLPGLALKGAPGQLCPLRLGTPGGSARSSKALQKHLCVCLPCPLT